MYFDQLIFKIWIKLDRKNNIIAYFFCDTQKIIVNLQHHFHKTTKGWNKIYGGLELQPTTLAQQQQVVGIGSTALFELWRPLSLG